MTQREEQVKEYRKKHFQITLNYEQHLLLRWLISEAFDEIRIDKFNLDDLAEQIYECRIIDGKVHTFSDEKLKQRHSSLDPNSAEHDDALKLAEDMGELISKMKNSDEQSRFKALKHLDKIEEILDA